MAIAVQKYMKNLGKSVVYTASDVLAEKFEYVNSFKNENQDVFKSAYKSVKDYRTTFNRVKKAITTNKVMDAARLGYDSVLYSIRTGDFYAKDKEMEIMEKSSGDFMSGFDIDDEDFDWDSDDVSKGEKVIATAIKKNSKINTAITAEAIAVTGKAQMDVAKENTMLLYTQNERMINKLDNGFKGVLEFMNKQEVQNAKVQNQMNENLNKFMANVDNNVVKLTKQMDELLEMQRNMYNPKKQEQKKRIGYSDIIDSSGVINLKEYGKQVGKQAFSTVDSIFGGGLSMLFGDMLGKDSNILATFAASPFRSLAKGGINKALSGSFDKAAKNLNDTLENIVPTLISRLNAQGKKDNGLLSTLGKIFGIKTGSKESINTNAYHKGQLPFDGITKRAITDVIPYYLRKMTSALTGEAEMVYDFQSGSWKKMSAIKQDHYNTTNSASKSMTSYLGNTISRATGRDLSKTFANKREYDRFMENLEGVANTLLSVGEFRSVTNDDLGSSGQREIYKLLEHILSVDKSKKDQRYFYDSNGKRIGSTGRNLHEMGDLNRQIKSLIDSQNNSIKSINEGDSILRIINAEGLTGGDIKSYRGSNRKDIYGRYKENEINKIPMAQILVHAKDEYGVTLYEYLRDMGTSLRYIKANSVFLNGINSSNNNGGNGENNNAARRNRTFRRLLESGDINYNKTDKDISLTMKYSNQIQADNDIKEAKRYEENINNFINNRSSKGKSARMASTIDFKGENGELGLYSLLLDEELDRFSDAKIKNTNEESKKEKDYYKKLEDYLGKERAQKLHEVAKKFDKDKTLSQNMASVKDQGFLSSLWMIGKYANNKMGDNSPASYAAKKMDEVTLWINQVLYGKRDKADEEKSLLDHLKDSFNSIADKITGTLEKGFEWTREKFLNPLGEKLKKPLEAIFGKKTDGIYEGGVFGDFIGGVQRGLRKNGEEVWKFTKEQAAQRARELGLKKDEEETTSTSGDSTSNNQIVSSITREAKRDKLNSNAGKRKGTKGQRYKQEYDETIAEINSLKAENKIISDRLKTKLIPIFDSYERNIKRLTPDQREEYEKLKAEIIQSENTIRLNRKKLKSLRARAKAMRRSKKNNEKRNKFRDSVGAFDIDINTDSHTLSNQEAAANNISRLENYNKYKRALEVLDNMGDHDDNTIDDALETIASNGQARRDLRSIERNSPRKRMRELKKLLDQGDIPDMLRDQYMEEYIQLTTEYRNSDKYKTIQRMKELQGLILSAKDDPALQTQYADEYKRLTEQIKTMAVGGENRTNRIIRSAVSPGEIITSRDGGSRVVTNTSIQNIMPGDKVFNPAPREVRQRQLSNERSLISRIRSNANTNDGLTDWTKLDRKGKAEFAGEMTSRGLIGGGIGLLAGGPILGAAIGAASSLTKSSGALSNFLFGNAITDEDGNVKDRADNGLISKELMDAVPEISKFGLGGLVTGLITPLGPIGGILAGSALGFAKKSEIFQGSLFGDGGIISDENIAKIKKGGVNIATGAILGSLLLPTGPFGLIGNTLLGSTIGYATSTDKFKDAILGEKIDPENPNSERQGGLLGFLKTAVEPLKDFGKTIIGGVTDAIFGEKKGDKREGGLFGLVRKHVVNPLIDGTKSILKEMKNSLTDVKFGIKKVFNDIRKSGAGKDFWGAFGEKANKVAGGAIKLGKGVASVALSPAMGAAYAVKGVGNHFKRKRIMNGRADDMTARERMAARGSLGMSAIDDYSDFDYALSQMDNESITTLMDRINFTANGSEAKNKESIKISQRTGSKVSQILNKTELNKFMKMLNKGEIKELERWVKTNKFKGATGSGITDADRGTLLGYINDHMTESKGLDKRFAKAQEAGEITSDFLKDNFGLDIDLTDEASVDSIMKYLQKEKSHNENGLTDEEKKFDALRDFWTNEESPLKTINEAIKNMDSNIQKMSAKKDYADEYDELSDKEKSKYGSKEDYVNKKMADREKAEQKKNKNDKDSSKKNNTKKKSRVAKVLENPDLFDEKIKKLVNDAVESFNDKIKNDLADKDKISIDIDKYITEKGQEKFDKGNKVKLSREMTIEKFDQKYEFSFYYSFDKTTNEVKVYAEGAQPKEFKECREDYANRYVEAYIPSEKRHRLRHINIKDIIKSAFKFSVLSIIVPGGAWGLLGLKILGKVNKKFNITGKAKNVGKSALKGAKYLLGSHEVNKTGKWQKRRDKKYTKKAHDALGKELYKVIDEGSKDCTLNDIAIEKYDTDYVNLSEEQQKAVCNTFLQRYVDVKRSKQIGGHGLVGNVKAVAGTIKSGIKNTVRGAIDFVKNKKEKEKEEDSFIGKFFKKYDAWKNRHDKEKVEGKKDSKLAKILKWLFVGGIAAPIITGFLKEKILPTIHEKIQPWLKKAGEKLIGVKNSEGEYEGGLVSGIVNPIRNFFKDKFAGVHDWFHNEGKYSDPNKGMSGLLLNIKNIGAYIIDLWKSGASTIYCEYLPKILQTVGRNLIPDAINVLKGLGSYILDLFKGRGGKNYANWDSSLFSNGDDKISIAGNSYTLNTGFGKTVPLNSPSVNGSISGGITTNSNGTTATPTDDGHIEYSNENNSNEKVVSEDSTGAYLSGKDTFGTDIYSKAGSNKQYVMAPNGDMIPYSEFLKIDHEELANNPEWQHYIDVENANAFENGISGKSAGSKILGATAKAVMFKNGLRIINPKAMSVAGKFSNKLLNGFGAKALSKIPFAGKGVKAMRAVGNVGSKALNGLSNLTLKPTEKLYTKIGNKVLGDKTKQSAAKLAGKVAAETSDDVAKKGASTAAKVVNNAGKKEGFLAKLLKVLKGIGEKIKGFFKKIFNNGLVKKAAGDTVAKNGDEIAEGIGKTVEDVLTNSADDIAKQETKLGAKAVAKAIPFISTVYDFLDGMDNCRNILGIIKEKPSFIERLCAGIFNAIPSVIMLLADVIAGASFGGAAAISGVMYVLAVIGIVLNAIDPVRDAIIGGIIDILDKVGINVDGIKKEREDAKNALENYNTKNNTNLSIEEYNNMIGNKTFKKKAYDKVANYGSAILGYDSATKNDILRKTEDVKGRNKDAEYVRKKLISVFSSIWQRKGEDDFNWDAYDGDGNLLEGKEKLNANNSKFTETATKIVTDLMILLNDKSDKQIDKVSSRVDDFTGPWDVAHRLEDYYNAGWNNAHDHTGIDDKYCSWNRIQAISGVCSVVQEIFSAIDERQKVTAIVLKYMIPAYFREDFRTDSEVLNWNKDKVNDTLNDNTGLLSGYESNRQAGLSTPDEVSTTASTVANGNQVVQDTINSALSGNGTTSIADAVAAAQANKNGLVYGPQKPATNANANDKLSAINPLSKLFNKKEGLMSTIFSSSFNDPLKAFTLGFDKVDEIFKSLSSKNRATNEAIDKLILLPTDKKYWEVVGDDDHPLISGLFTFVESIKRVVKAPFALAAHTMKQGLSAMVSSSNKTTGTKNSTSTKSDSGDAKEVKSSANSVTNSLKKFGTNIVNGIKGLFGRGISEDNDDMTGYGNDPYHIYQRNYAGSFRTAGDTERQTVADSGCGPAAAASLLRMYGKKGDMNNAVNYALNNKYKEVNGGTYPQYFHDYLNKNGISTNSNANNADVVNNLAHGKPVILMGRDSSNSGKTPYGSKYSHYVVARGIDKNGNVIVEDSEDKRGSTRYSLADTLKNSSVKITTGKGVYGRAKDTSVISKYISNVNAATVYQMTGVTGTYLNQFMNGANSGTTTASSNNNTTKSYGNVNIDDKSFIICGDSITMGLATTSLKERAMGQGSGTTNIKGVTDVGSYDDVFNHPDVWKNAKDVAFFWGMNEVHDSISPEDYFNRYQQSIDTILGYGGLTTSDVNIYILPVIWVPDRSGVNGSYNAKAVEAFNDKYIRPFAKKKGYKLVDIYEDSKEVPHSAGNVHPSNYQKLYEIIKKHMGGSSESGSGRGKSIIRSVEDKNNVYKSGVGRYGRGEEDTSSGTIGPKTLDQTLADKAAENTDTASTEENKTDTKSSTKKNNSNAKSFTSLLTNYGTMLTKGIFGNAYDALFGTEPQQEESSSSSTGGGTGALSGMVGKTLTMSRNNGEGTLTSSVTIYDADVELYDMLTGELGLNDAVASGVLANWKCENGDDIKTTATKGIIYYGGGIMQWTASGGGENPHLAWVKTHPEYASDPWSWEANKAHAFEELKTGETNWWRIKSKYTQPTMASQGYTECENMEDFRKLTSPEDAGVNYERAFEGSYNWDGVTSEKNAHKLAPEELYDNVRALKARIVYEMAVNNKTGNGGTASGSGRGKSIINSIKIGRGIYGRGEEDTSSSTVGTAASSFIGPKTLDQTLADKAATTDTTNQETTTEDTTKTTKKKTASSAAKEFINNMTTYSTKITKGIFGNAYDALFGEEQVSTTSASSGTAGTLGSIPYNQYGIWKQGAWGGDHAICDGWANKISVFGETLQTSGCSVVAHAMLLAHSGTVQESDFDPGVFNDDMVSRASNNTSGYDKTNFNFFCMYKGDKSMQVSEQKQDSFAGSSFDELYDYCLESMKQGYFLIGHVTHHYVCIDYIDTAHKVIFIMDPGYRANCWYDGNNKPDCLDNTDNGYTMSTGPNRKCILGVTRYKSTKADASNYVLNGRRSFDSLHENGDAPNATISGNGYGRGKKKNNNSAINKISTGIGKKKITAPASAMYAPNSGTIRVDDMGVPIHAKTNNILKSYDDIVYTGSGRGRMTSSTTNRNNSYTNTGRGYSTNTMSSSGNSTIDLNQLINLISVIANNSDKMDAIVQLLGTIAVNTENTTTAVKSNTPKKTANDRGLTALQSVLSSNSSGQDIAKAVYQIARS